ncbi:class I SAM-dependent methyltransferase [Lachnotalea glycerini]|jgi:SAM-dependent methyltransferase|uniref:Class I SAM-dependent methyltransferase n=2 Tax=Lachnotalea glycerini TaxID=1763509 RepID=A0A371J1Z2_9FIRM|nr:class I SAM-dependent methyltransferase [Lachnotalea glycerini]
MEVAMSKEVLNLTYYKGEDLYSDGEVEDKILEIFKNKEDIQKRLMQDDDWAILYHLSPIRQNILEWYDFDKNASILEIGSGCGAISGLFCEKVKRVVGIELSKRRSMINAERNKQYDNLEIMVGNFEDIELTETFDYVTLIGVLEYADSYISADKPYEEMLRRVKKFLKPNGKLIIAIENKFGLKYFAGAMEDHTGNLFDGIENYKNVSSVRTFSKNEIEELLCSAGYQGNEFYYPVPDYKLPNAVYAQEYLPKSGDLRNMSVAYDRARFKLFDEDIVYDQLCKDHKFEYFSNSFLIFAKA